jgi:hypothetical protein
MRSCVARACGRLETREQLRSGALNRTGATPQPLPKSGVSVRWLVRRASEDDCVITHTMAPSGPDGLSAGAVWRFEAGKA